MRHKCRRFSLNRSSSHRKSLARNLVVSLVERGRIMTTLPKAKFLRPIIEKLITKGKQDRDLFLKYRILQKKLNNLDISKKIITDLSARYLDRNGGYTRIIKLNNRKGDCAECALIEFV